MNKILVEIDAEQIGLLSDVPHVVIREYPAADSIEALAMLKMRAQLIKDASFAYKEKMQKVDDIDKKLNNLNTEQF